MGTTNLFLIVLVVGTITTGCMNTLFTKNQDNQCVKNCHDSDPKNRVYFEQPAIQTLQMFIGESCCYFVYRLMFRRRRAGYVPIDGEGAEPLGIGFKDSLKLSIPAMCDLCGTTLLNFGLIFIPASVYQMMRGSIVLFVAFLSVVFLKRRISKLEWIALVVITLGIALVGLSGSQASDDSPRSNSALVALGISLVVVAEFCQAIQFVVEEYILGQQPLIPLQLVYYEGFYGASVIAVVMVVLNFIIGSISTPEQFVHSPFNLVEGFGQLFSSYSIMQSSVLIMASIAAFNFFGISLTYHLSATARSTIDTCRTLLVWLMALAMGWESFSALQFLGFVVLVFGTLCFNGVLKPETWRLVPAALKTPPPAHEVDEPIDRL